MVVLHNYTIIFFDISISPMHVYMVLIYMCKTFNVFWLFLLLIPLSFVLPWEYMYLFLRLGVGCASLVFGWVEGNPLVGITKALPFW